ncbi:MAG: outer membrane lipoprotein-sorting protein [Bacteroidia bacterium]|nr:outer membrane lipoprotein-sorting protein [Bacteroidia bacterium]NNJ55799.1 outer membrane lipoprotein-sorting protein [Bacteroidia bacterium]
MKYLTILLVAFFALSFATSQDPDANAIIKKIDANMISNSNITTSKMTIYGRRNDRTITAKSYGEGSKKSFTEYLSPEREKGTKMLKLDDKLWIYSPSSDRTIQISGHMLKQSVMGSDLSYEDMMDERKLTEIYTAVVSGSEVLDGRKTWVIDLIAKVTDATYEKQKIWVDKEKFVPLRQDMMAKSGKILKRVSLSNIEKISGRWYPKRMNYKDMLKQGKGTDFEIVTIEFNPKIPAHIFTKASLKK